MGTIIIDCDNTILDFTTIFVEWWNESKYKPVIKDPFGTYMFGIPDKHDTKVLEAIDKFYNTQYISNLPLMYLDVPEYLGRISNEYRDVRIVTHCPTRIYGRRMTNLVKLGVDMKKITLVCTDDKSKYLKAHAMPKKDNPVILADDKPDTIIAAWAAGFITFFPYLPYTKDLVPTYGKAFNSFKELYDLIQVATGRA